jgi:hypothetical protein
MSWRSYDIDKNKQLLLFVAASKSSRIICIIVDFLRTGEVRRGGSFRHLLIALLNFTIFLGPTPTTRASDLHLSHLLRDV